MGIKKGIISMEGSLAIPNKTIFFSTLGPNKTTSLEIYFEDMPPKYENTCVQFINCSIICNDEILETI